MNLKINNTRELKSLLLSNKIKTLKTFLEDSNRCGIFITCATLHPIERIKTHQQFLMNDLKITRISHKLIKIIFKFNAKETFKNLLSGPVYLIQDSSNSKSILTKNKLNSILSYKPFTLRFLYINQQLYRNEEIFPLLEHITTSAFADPLISIKSKNILLF